MGCNEKNDNAEQPNEDDSAWVQEPRGVFKPVQIVPSPFRESYVGHFLFINKTKKKIKIPGYSPPVRGKFSPSPESVVYQIESNGQWKRVDGLLTDGLPRYFDMSPKTQYEFVIDLWPIKNTGKPVNARVVLAGFTSERFVLDWAKDRREGNFASARKQHIDKLRRLFLQAGFKPDLISQDDFCQRFLESLMAVTGSNQLGFDRFKGNLDVLPKITSYGGIDFVFHSDVLLNHQYQYGCAIQINPSNFTPTWFLKSYAKHVQVGVWGNARRIKFDDGTRLLPNQSRFYFAVKYRSPEDKGLPDEESSRKLFMNMLHNLGGWLKEE
jgi:hypothetical protein